MAAELLIDLSTKDLTREALNKEQIRKLNPHRHEFEMLDAVVHLDLETSEAIGYHDLKPDAFWVRGHIPGMPLFPGALMIEAAAQLSSICFQLHFPSNGDRFFGFGGIDNVKFREMAKPGQRLYILCRKLILNRRFSRFAVQGVVDGRITFEGEIVGVSIPMPTSTPRAAEAQS